MISTNQYYSENNNVYDNYNNIWSWKCKCLTKKHIKLNEHLSQCIKNIHKKISIKQIINLKVLKENIKNKYK